MTNLKSETTTNQEQGKKIEADMTSGCMHSVVRRSSGGGVVEQRRFLLSPCVSMCLNFEDDDTKKASKIMESSITKRAREFMESSRKRKREENERAGELLESSGSKGKK